MIFTSYFAKIKKFPENVIPIAICAKVPSWYKGLRYPLLAPKYDALMKYKDNHNEADYIECYNNTTLKSLNPLWVLAGLRTLLPYSEETHIPVWENPNFHIALVCYEKPSDFCHRQLVAEWLRRYGVECKEWEEEK